MHLRFKYNLEFENGKQTEHHDLKDGIAICIVKQPLPSGLGWFLKRLLKFIYLTTLIKEKEKNTECNCE